ncbi:hypothetical protein K504DRAFT_503141 [Pleomassaria siparia CBS 279.74]|uniref:J domain-containing protein n=1 Tax=Pleomassaria siparia CBS 279.74 TaxID=1314801 RepID=A0A6G1K9N0_9PLEO|nr:hypothetical protein K504DRAFT_503141 [Pleomassaria siparia CBS 279.74]
MAPKRAPAHPEKRSPRSHPKQPTPLQVNARQPRGDTAPTRRRACMDCPESPVPCSTDSLCTPSRYQPRSQTTGLATDRFCANGLRNNSIQAATPTMQFRASTVGARMRSVYTSARHKCNGGIQKTQTMLHTYKRLIYATAIALGLLSHPLSLAHANITHYANTPSPHLTFLPSMNQTQPYPTWLHVSNPYTVLGLPEPLVQGWVPPSRVIDSQYRKASKSWHTDKWAARGFASPKEALTAYSRLTKAKERFDEYWENPYRGHRIFGVDGVNMADVIGHTEWDCKFRRWECMEPLPHYGKNCNGVCTWRSAAQHAYKAAITPVEQQQDVFFSMASHCPCSLGKLFNDLKTNLEPSRIPPSGMRRYYERSPTLAQSWNPVLIAFKWYGHMGIKPWNWDRDTKTRFQIGGKGLGWTVSDDFKDCSIPQECETELREENGGDERKDEQEEGSE